MGNPVGGGVVEEVHRVDFARFDLDGRVLLRAVGV